jgi:hypothetical protein
MGAHYFGETNAFDWRTSQPLLPQRVLFGLDSVDIDPSGRFAALGGFQREMNVLDLDDLLESDEMTTWPDLQNHSDSHREFLDRFSADELVTWAELLSNQRMVAGGATNNMTSEQWRERWQLFPHRRRQ